jgi:SAM-dependent methyltransferase
MTQFNEQPPSAPVTMRIHAAEGYESSEEIDLMEALLPLRDRRVLELGCGAAWTTRLLVGRLGAASVSAYEVDRIQHEKNLALDLPGVSFHYGGAQSIAEPDGGFDAVLMLKSLHHVPVAQMDQALLEVHRVLKPGGLFYCSEPVYWGSFNDLMRLIEDERVVREAAFAALVRAVAEGLFALEQERFFQSEGIYPDWETFQARFIDVTHSDRNLDAGRRAEIRAAFERHLTPEGARFQKPHRVDLLRKAA